MIEQKVDHDAFLKNSASFDSIPVDAFIELGYEKMVWAESVRDADRIVVAAPFWDMSIPAVLKNFFELCSIICDICTKYGLCIRKSN